jgi:putative oxidoreductase
LNNGIKRLPANAWVELSARWILGITFIYASFYKILEPAGFAKIIYGYDLFPHLAINLMAITVPWLELVAGAALLAGIYPKSAALMINVMLAAYIIILSINLIRGHRFDCGCLSPGQVSYINSAGQWIVRDIFCLLLGGYIFTFSSPRKCAITSGAPKN